MGSHWRALRPIGKLTTIIVALVVAWALLWLLSALLSSSGTAHGIG